ncbi:hypothetical protein EWM64_g1268 [Hericium alpestre]|uniref:DUF4604 domain-containing protein n=1 Tax=Hericium alpestre TaxID=135208 RepID=A0A4Z0A8A5_9AGAM|nr:hypothetical protein EWM64_g1268 [Hericium alpestre]
MGIQNMGRTAPGGVKDVATDDAWRRSHRAVTPASLQQAVAESAERLQVRHPQWFCISEMAPRELTRHQLSSRISYDQRTPAFLQKLKNRVAGVVDEDEDEDDEFEYDGSGRPPIPKRPAIPERPADEPGSADEDAGDELPQVVVLKEGKHLTRREVENEKRKGGPFLCSGPCELLVRHLYAISAKGLPPLPEPESKRDASTPDDNVAGQSTATKIDKVTSKPQSSLSFSSGLASKKSAGKRKTLSYPSEDETVKDKKSSKKAKKAPKTLLSFSDDA